MTLLTLGVASCQPQYVGHGPSKNPPKNPDTVWTCDCAADYETTYEVYYTNNKSVITDFLACLAPARAVSFPDELADACAKDIADQGYVNAVCDCTCTNTSGSCDPSDPQWKPI